MSPVSVARAAPHVERNGKHEDASAVSVATKLFGKRQENGSLLHDNNENAENKAQESMEPQNEDEEEEDEEDEESESMEEEEDEEYLPQNDGENEEEDEEEDEEDEEEDETPSVRSLLPLRLSLTLSRRRRASAARYSERGQAQEQEQEQEEAEELLDDGEFDAQDAELWSSRAEKRAWIQRFERANADFIDKYGCRIDSAAHPDAALRLRRERRREGPYSLILLALVLGYGIHLAVFPHEVPQQLQPMKSTASSISQSASLWSRWTSWPVDALHWASKQSWSSVGDWPQIPKTVKRPLVQEEQDSQETASHVSPTPSTTSSVDETSIQQARDEDVVISRPVDARNERADANDLERVTRNAIEPSTPTSVMPELTSPQSSGETMSQQQPPPIKVDAQPQRTAHDDTDAHEARAPEQQASVKVGRPTSDQGDILDKGAEHAVESPSESTPRSDAQQGRSDSRSAVRACTTAFYKLITNKGDMTVRSSAIDACDRAVDATTPSSMAWIQARVLRGDMWSILNQFDVADFEYEEALNQLMQLSPPPKVTDVVILKKLSNRWTHLFTSKEMKLLREECQFAVQDRSQPTEMTYPPDAVALAQEWLRAFKREITPLTVLMKSRSWTAHRPIFPLGTRERSSVPAQVAQ